MQNAVGNLPDNLPSISSARLPIAYEAAKTALAECSRIDECKTWADKAEALASYAKQANDDQLRKHADRIQARAIQRCGELYEQLESKQGARTDLGTVTTRGSIAADAGLSERQRKTALRVARIPKAQFESLVESENPPTVTALAELGKKTRPLVDLNGIDPKDFVIATDAQDQLRRLSEFANKTSARQVAGGARPNERRVMRNQIAIIQGWIEQLDAELSEDEC